jgi:hypothetical protein
MCLIRISSIRPRARVPPTCIEEISDQIQTDSTENSVSLHTAGTYVINYECMSDF